MVFSGSVFLRAWGFPQESVEPVPRGSCPNWCSASTHAIPPSPAGECFSHEE